MVIAKRLLAALLVVVAVLVAAPAMADDGIMPPPTDTQHQALVDKYEPDSLQFYTDATSWMHPGKQMRNGVTDVLSAMFALEASIVKWTVRLLDYAWNFNLARSFGAIIDSVAGRFSKVVWSFGGLLCMLIAAWMVYQVWNGTLSKVLGFCGVLGVVLAFAVITQSGIAGIVADVDDVSTEISGQVLTAGAVGQTPQDGVANMTDGVYRQLILEQWARGNFTSLEAASKYQADGIPGGAYLGLSAEEAQVHKDKDAKAPGGENDFKPWDSDSALSQRIGIVFETALSLFLFLPILFLLSLIVFGVKGFTIILAMAVPVALFWAALPWTGGLRSLKNYAIWTCLAPIVKVVCSFGLAMYMAFLNGLIGAGKVVPGGWGTVTLLMGAMAGTLFLIIRPILSAGAGVFRRGYHKAKAHDEAVARTRAKAVASREKAEAKAEQAARPKRAPVSRKKWTTQTGRRLHVLRPGQKPPAEVKPKPASSVASGGGPARRGLRRSVGEADGTSHRDRRRHVQDLGTYMALRDRQHTGIGHKRLLPEYDMADLLREAKRVVRAMGHAAENLGGRRR